MSDFQWLLKIIVVMLCNVVHSQNMYSNFRQVSKKSNFRNPIENFSSSERKSNFERGSLQDHMTENTFSNLDTFRPFENSNLDNKNWIKVNYRVSADKKLETQIADSNFKVSAQSFTLEPEQNPALKNHEYEVHKPNYYFLKPNMEFPKPNYDLQKPNYGTHNLKPNYGIVESNWQFLKPNSGYPILNTSQTSSNSTNQNYNKNIEIFSNPQNFVTSTEAESIVIQPSTQFSVVFKNKLNVLNKTHHAFQATTVSNIESTISVPPVLQPTVSSSFNNSNSTSYRHPDLLKQMKLQFVLDCALVDRNTQTRIPLDSNIPENIQNLLPNSKAQTTTTSTTTVKPLPLSPTSVQTTIYRIPPRRDPVKYMDPPVLEEISDVFEDVYSYFEEALTTKVVSKPQKTKKVAEVYNILHVTPVQQSQHKPQSKPNQNHNQQHRTTRKIIHSRIKTTPLPQRKPLIRYKRTTIHPRNKYATKAHEQNKKNYMTTNIHVTSEYNGPSPTSSVEANAKKRRPTVNSASSSASNDDDDDDGYIDYEEDENLGLDQLNIMSEDDDVDNTSNSVSDDSKLSVEKDHDEDYSLRTPKNPKQNRRKSSKKVKLPTKSEEEEEEDYYGESMGLFGGFFETVFSPFGRFMPSFLLSGDSYDDQESRSTTPRTDWRKPKYPTSFQASTEDSALTYGKPWFNPWFFGGSNEIDEVTTPKMPTTTESDSWNWFGSAHKTPDTEETTEKNGWFFGLFNRPTATTTTTTTIRPFLTIANPLQNPHTWLSILAHHLSTTTTAKTPTVSVQLIRKNYTSHQLWRLMPTTEDQLKFLQDYRVTPEGAKLQWWKGPTLRGPTDVLVPNDVISDAITSLEYEDIPYDVIIWDMEKAIQYENPKISKRELIEMVRSQGHPLSWYRYHRYDDIVKFLEYLQRKYPEIVELHHIGRSFEGRPLIVAKFSAPVTKRDWKDEQKLRKRKPLQQNSIFIEAGAHSREWIGPATATWILNSLIKMSIRNDTVAETIRSVDWYVLPVLNPDGYEYSHEYDRLWRKSRSKHPETSGSMFSISTALNWIRSEKNPKEEQECVGTDLNRNWKYNWNEIGASHSTCSDFYSGPVAFSEPETKALSKFLMENKKNIKLYIAMHSYGQILTYPTTANSSYTSNKIDDLHDMANVALESLRGSGSSSRYTVDTANEMLYPRAGSSDSYVMYEAGIKYSYTLELRDTGTHGFLLPPSNIDSTAKDAFEIVKGMIDYI